jgi:hypothetical protein
VAGHHGKFGGKYNVEYAVRRAKTDWLLLPIWRFCGRDDSVVDDVSVRDATAAKSAAVTGIVG